MTTQYSLTCINNSRLPGSFAIFQRPPPIVAPGDVYALAWFAQTSHPQTQVTFQWTVDYSFMWSETGVLKPGITFIASQVIPADPMGENFIDLTVDSYGASYFTPPTATGEVGALTIRQLSNVVPNRTSCGIGMSGAAAYAVQAAENITTVFKPHPNYWVVFGHFQAGQVIDFEEITGEVEVSYGGSVTSRTVTLQADNLLVVS
jgi:rhizosphere induced protein